MAPCMGGALLHACVTAALLSQAVCLQQQHHNQQKASSGGSVASASLQLRSDAHLQRTDTESDHTSNATVLRRSAITVWVPNYSEVRTVSLPWEHPMAERLLGTRVASKLRSTMAVSHGSFHWWFSEDNAFGPSPQTRLCCLIVGMAAALGIWVSWLLALLARQLERLQAREEQDAAQSAEPEDAEEQRPVAEEERAAPSAPRVGAGLGLDEADGDDGASADDKVTTAEQPCPQPAIEEQQREVPPMTAAPLEVPEVDTSDLVNNARVLAVILLLFDKQDNIADASGFVHQAVSMVHFPMLCFIAGLCSQGPSGKDRWLNFITRLLGPMFLWTYIVQPVFLRPLLDPHNWQVDVYEFLTGQHLFNLVTRNVFQEIPYLWYLVPGLAAWTSLVLLIGQRLQSRAFLGVCFAASAFAGYVDLDSNPIHLPLNATFGYLPYFALGYVFNLPLACKLMQSPGPARSLIASLMVVLWTTFMIPQGIEEPLPLPAQDYKLSLSGSDHMPVWDFRLFWTRRLSKVALDTVAFLALLLMVLPRTSTPFTECGKHAIYPYMFQQLARHILGGFISLGGVTGGAVDVLYLPWAVLVVLMTTSKLWRSMWQWCLEPAWMDRALLPIFMDGEVKTPAAENAGGAASEAQEAPQPNV